MTRRAAHSVRIDRHQRNNILHTNAPPSCADGDGHTHSRHTDRRPTRRSHDQQNHRQDDHRHRTPTCRVRKHRISHIDAPPSRDSWANDTARRNTKMAFRLCCNPSHYVNDGVGTSGRLQSSDSSHILACSSPPSTSHMSQRNMLARK